MRAAWLFELAAVVALTAASCATAPTANPTRVLVAVQDWATPTAAAQPQPQRSADATLAATAPPLHPRPTSIPLPAPPTFVDLPIYMYHHVQTVPPAHSSDAQLKDLSVPPTVFARQLELLASHGIQTVNLDDLVAILQGRMQVPRRAVILTFDDGYDDLYSSAFPIARKLGMRGVAFVISDFVGQTGYATWDQLREMHRAGWQIESHSISHPDLRMLQQPELLRQLRESRARIEAEIGAPVHYLNYPSGKYNARVVGAAALAGYSAAVTVLQAYRYAPRQVLELPRVRVHGGYAAEAVVSLLPPEWH